MKKINKIILNLSLLLVFYLAFMPSVKADDLIRIPEEIKFDENIAMKSVIGDSTIFEAKELVIDGKSFGRYINEEEINEVLSNIVNRYLNPNIDEEVNILNDIEIKDTLTTNTDLKSKKDLYDLILDDKRIEEFNINVKKNDSLKDILDKYMISKEELIKYNKDLEDNLSKNEDDIEIFNKDSKVKFFLNKAKIDVETYRKIKRNVDIKYSTRVEKSDSLYIGQREISKKGIEGIKEEVIKISNINGNKKEDKILSEKILRYPEEEVILEGTLEEGIASGIFMKPCKGSISSPFGYRSRGFHGGTDICNSYGTSIYASDGGEVVEAGWDGSYGLKVLVDHKNGYKTIYAHASSIMVNVGDKVKKGDLLALMGSTGNSTGNHLHFEIRRNNVRENPENYVNLR